MLRTPKVGAMCVLLNSATHASTGPEAAKSLFEEHVPDVVVRSGVVLTPQPI